MAYSELTKKGKEFITHICSSFSTKILTGKNSYVFPYTNTPYSNKVWVCDIKYNGKQLTNATDVANALIDWYNKYANIYKLDANIIAAQAYVATKYYMWYYAEDVTASGVPQLTMLTFYNRYVKNIDTASTSTDTSIPKITKNEIEVIINGLTDKYDVNSYNVGGATPEVARSNRPIFHQNVINNPEIMIKIQCDYMKSITNNCDSIASTSLFCYSRGSEYVADTYSDALLKCKNDKGEEYMNYGLDYVLEIFGVLGDEDNLLVSKGAKKKYKPKGIYFGYDSKNFPDTDPKNLRLNEEFNMFGANVNLSIQYNESGNVKYPKDFPISNYMWYHQAISVPSMSITKTYNGVKFDRRKYDNTPNEEEYAKLITLAQTIYDPICKHFNTEIPITTAYRGEFLNGPVSRGGVGGDANSQHRFGEAMDLNVNRLTTKVNFTNADVFYFIVNNLSFGQIIWEEGGACSPGWVHVSLIKSEKNHQITLYNSNFKKDKYLHSKTLTEFNALKLSKYGPCK